MINVNDITSGQSLTRNEKCASNLTCDRSSADVIAEDVGMFGGSGFFPLADYQTMSFGGAKITNIKGQAGSFTNAAWLRGSVKETSGGVTYATVSPLSGGGRVSAPLGSTPDARRPRQVTSPMERPSFWWGRHAALGSSRP